MDVARRKRRRILVDEAQVRLMTINLIHMSGAVLVATSAILLPLLIDLHSDSLSLDRLAEVSQQFLVLHSRIWVAVPIIVLFFVLHGVYVSHRIVGPLARVRETLDAVGSGDLGQGIAVRRRDFLAREATSVNGMIESLRSKLGAIGDRYAEARTALDDLGPALGGDGPSTLPRSTRELRVRLDRLGQAIAEFRLGSEIRFPAVDPVRVTITETGADCEEPTGSIASAWDREHETTATATSSGEDSRGR